MGIFGVRCAVLSFTFFATAAVAVPQLQSPAGPAIPLTGVECREANDRLTITATGADGVQLTMGIAQLPLQASWHTVSTFKVRRANPDFSVEYHDGTTLWGLTRNRAPVPQCDLTLTRSEDATITVGLDCQNLKDENVERPGLKSFTLTGDPLTCTLARALR